MAGLVGITQDGPKSVGTALFDVSDVLTERPAPGGPVITFAPTGAATVGALDVELVGPYLYVSNENGFQVLDLR